MVTLNHSRKFLEWTETTRRLLLEPASPSSEGLDASPRQKPAEGSSRGPYMGESSFDTNMVVILAALLCALICALGLNSIVRCALRCSRARAVLFESAEDVEARLANTGMKRKALRALPTAVYGAAGSKLPCTDCPICLAEFLEGDEVRILPKCNHGFHMRCIDTWLASHSSCPTCRQNLLELSRSNKKNNNEGNVNMNTNMSDRPAPPSTQEGLQHIQVEGC
uniref:RING-type domain-containing protein n=1 Tax=Picea sitchensis TaxID=3332 RepID=A9NYQ0_PICSI|nr:unknown [Picea sitchensis]